MKVAMSGAGHPHDRSAASCQIPWRRRRPRDFLEPTFAGSALRDGAPVRRADRVRPDHRHDHRPHGHRRRLPHLGQAPGHVGAHPPAGEAAVHALVQQVVLRRGDRLPDRPPAKRAGGIAGSVIERGFIDRASRAAPAAPCAPGPPPCARSRPASCATTPRSSSSAWSRSPPTSSSRRDRLPVDPHLPAARGRGRRPPAADGARARRGDRGHGPRARLRGLALADFDSATSGLQFVTNDRWIPSLGIRWKLGIDGLNLFLVLLTTVLWTASTIWASLREWERPKLFFFHLALAETAVLGALLAQDLALFVIFFDLMLSRSSS